MIRAKRQVRRSRWMLNISHKSKKCFRNAKYLQQRTIFDFTGGTIGISLKGRRHVCQQYFSTVSKLEKCSSYFLFFECTGTVQQRRTPWGQTSSGSGRDAFPIWKVLAREASLLIVEADSPNFKKFAISQKVEIFTSCSFRKRSWHMFFSLRQTSLKF